MGEGRRALVTGANGFVGSHLVKRLVGDGWHVECVVRPGSDCSVLPDEVARRVHDGSTDALIEILTQSAPHVVFHLAAVFVSEHISQQVQPLLVSNVMFGTQLLEAMTVAGVDCLVNTGTSWQHYQDADYNPVNLYAATKQAFETIARYYASARGLRMLTLELTDTYGPDDHRAKLFSVLHDAALSGRRLEMSGGEQLVDIVYIDDVIDAFLLAARVVATAPTGSMRSCAIHSGAPLSLRDLVERYMSVTGRHVDVRWGGRQYREREVMAPPSRTSSLGGWRPSVGLEAGIRRLEHLPDDGDQGPSPDSQS